MAEKKVIELEVKTDSVGNLKSELRKAQAEVAELSAKFGATSQEAINAAKRAAELKDTIADAKALTDAFNPDAKFNALSASIGGVLNGFQAFEGALGVIGVDSEDLQQTLLKVQSAMALSQGIQGVLEAKDSFIQLKAVIGQTAVGQTILTGATLAGAAAMKVFNAVMSLNPIGLIITGITSLIAVSGVLIKMFYDSAEATEQANKSMDRHTKALERQERQAQRSSKVLKDANQYQYDYAKAAGASSEQLRKLALKHQEEELALAKKNLELAKSTYLREQDILASYRANDASEELLKRQTEIVTKAREATTNARASLVNEYDELKNLRRQQKVEIRQEEFDAAKEAKERLKEASQTRKEIVKETTQEIIKETRKQGEITQEEEDFFTQMLIDSEAEKDKIRQEAKAKQEEDELMLMQFRGDLYKQDIDNVEKAEAEKKKLREDNLKSSVKAGVDALNLIASIAEMNAGEDINRQRKAFGIRKAANIASATIDGYKAVLSTYADTPGGPVIKGIAAAIAGAFAALQIASIAKQEFNASATSGGGSNLGSNNMSSGASTITPNFNIVGNAQATNPLAGLGNQPLQAYVVSGEVTTAQNLDRNRINYATFG
jgi:hypothetical protein